MPQGPGGGNSSNSSNNNNQPQSRFRPLLPSSAPSPPVVATTGGTAGTGSGPPSADGAQTTPPPPGPAQKKKKRSTVPAACQACRKRKVKCDGVRPTCAPCTGSGAVCEYAVPEGLSQRDAERQKSHDLRTILTLLRRARGPESAEILRQVREAETLDDAIARIADASLLLPAPPPAAAPSQPAAPITTMTIARAPTPPRIENPGRISPISSLWTGNKRKPERCIRPDRRIQSPFDKPDYMFESLFERSFRDGEGSGAEPRILDMPTATVLPVSRWTTVSDDNAHLTHLIKLFWTWDNTFIRVFDHELFLEDMRIADPTAPTPSGVGGIFCSSFLVNCLLAVGCLYSTQDRIYDVLEDNNSRGRRFANEAKRLLPLERTRPSLTLMQGVALLWLWEGSVADGEVAAAYFEEVYRIYFALGLDRRMAPSPLPDMNSAEGRLQQAISHILWGFFYLNAKIGLNFTSRLKIPRPRFPKTFEMARASYLSRYESPTYHWCAYPVNFRYHPSHFREVLVAECAFAEIVEDIMMESGYDEAERLPEYGMATLLRYEAIYERLRHWKASLPDYLQPNNSNLPSVLSLHATFDMAVIKLLTPMAAKFANQRFCNSTPSTLKIAAAFSLINNIWTFRSLYTLKHEYWLMQSCFTAANAVLFDLDKGAADVFVRACQGLHEMGEFLSLANKFLQIIQNLITQYRIRIPDVGRTVSAKYFVALKSRKTTKYIDGTRVLLGGDEGLMDFKVSDVIASTIQVHEIGPD